MATELYRIGHVGDLVKVGSRLPEAREFILAYDPALDLAANARRAQAERWYGSTTDNACRRLTVAFFRRFCRLPGQLPALKRLLGQGDPAWLPVLNHLCLVAADPYYRWAATEYLPPRAAAGRVELYREDMERELAPRLPPGFTGPTVNRYARNIMTALRDNGFLAGGIKKRLASPPLPVAALGFALYQMAEAGQGARAFDGSPLFLSLLKSRELLVPLFLEGERLGFWEFTGDRLRLQINLRYRGLAPWLEAYLP